MFFGIVLDNTLYLRADDHTRGEFEHAGRKPFGYLRKGKRATLNFCRAPEEAMDAPELMLPRARSAVGAALRARAGNSRRPARKRRPLSAAGKRSRRR